jgi:hypothetical protein
MANNVWKMTAKDKDGKPVESAPGMTTFIMRGPEKKATVELHGQYLLNSMRQREFDNTGVDPGYKVDKVEPAGEFSDPAVDLIGEWRPRGAEPVNLPPPKDLEE